VYGVSRIILTGACAPGFPSLANALSDYWILATDFKDSLSAQQIANYFAMTPDLYPFTRGTVDEYVESIGTLAVMHDIDVIVPIRTMDVEALAGTGVVSTVPAENRCTVAMLNDKFLLLVHAKDRRGSVPEFGVMNNMMDAAILKYPLVVKPREGSGSRGMRIVEAKYPFVNDMLFKKPSECIRINTETLGEILEIQPMLWMEYLPGVEYTVDCLAYKGKLIAMVPRRRDAMKGGISSRAEVVKDENYDIMFKTCKEIIRYSKLSYALGFQFKCDTEGVPKLIECNPRLQGSTCLTVAAGLNIAKLSVELALGEISPDDIHVDIRWGTRFERTYTEWYE
jgi:carbamoyl-phosphate synthase large subunit